jgi:uncharacterized protein YciI
MLFMVRFTDRPDAHDVRRRYLAEHLVWLDQHKEKVRVGGSLRTAPGEPPVGGLWIVDATDKGEIQGLVQSDPFWANGLRESIEILHWSKAFPDREIPV